jgi:hypothetical protein
MRAIEREVKAGETSLRRALRDAAMCGAEEERSRALKIVRLVSPAHTCTTLCNLIVAKPILAVLGYTKAMRQKKAAELQHKVEASVVRVMQSLYASQRNSARCKSRNGHNDRCTLPANHTGHHTCLEPTGGWTGVRFRKRKRAAKARRREGKRDEA